MVTQKQIYRSITRTDGFDPANASDPDKWIIRNNGYRGAIFVLSGAAIGGAGTLTALELHIKDLYGTWRKLYEFTTLSVGQGQTAQLLIYPCASLSAAVWTKTPLVGPIPALFRIKIVGSGDLAWSLNMESLA